MHEEKKLHDISFTIWLQPCSPKSLENTVVFGLDSAISIRITMNSVYNKTEF